MHPDKFMGRAGKPAAPRISDEERSSRLERLGQVIAGKRKEAVDARRESGIEAVWLACEEAYLGIDDANRHEFVGARWAKSTSISGPITTAQRSRDDARSNAFVRLTSRYVDFAASKVGEIILAIDDKPFKLEPTPDPVLVKQAKDMTPILDAAGQQVQKPPADDAPEGELPTPMTVADKAAELMAEAHDRAERAETRIYDWLVESKYPGEARKIIHDAARIGTGIIKGPFPDFKQTRALTKIDGGAALQIQRKVIPAVKWVDPWNIFPEDGCGENIHNGDGLFERDFLSAKMLKKLKDDEQYLSSQIDKVIEEGPGKVYADGANPNERGDAKRNRFEIWYYFGTLKREDFEAVSADGASDIPPGKEDVSAIVSMVNDTVIRAVLNPLDSGSFPYHAVTWSRRSGHWAGVGVGEQIAMPQRAVNASTRALFNNAGWSSGVQIVIDQLGIVPADGSWTITPNKVWYKTAESSAAKVGDAFQCVVIPSVQERLSAIIDYAMKMAEDASGIPLLTQGQNGPTAPQTFGQAELQDNNAHTWLRNVGYRYDDMITEPLVQDYYEWLLLDDNVPDEEKGDFNINASGSSAMVERAIQETTLMGFLGAVANPAFRIDPVKLFAEIAKSKRMDPRKLQFSKEQQEQMDKQPPPDAPAVVAAKIKAATDIHKQDMADQTRLATANLDRDRDTAYNDSLAHRDEIALQGQREELALRRELAMLEYANRQNLTLQDVKARMAETVMKLNTQIELSRDAHAVDLHKHSTPQVVTPPTEPIGRAPNGEAFQA